MARIKIYSKNILENSTVSVTNTPVTGFPITRAYDRNLSFLWKDSSTEAGILVRQPVVPNDVDLLVIETHNISNIQWKYSDDGINFYDAVAAWTQIGSEKITKSLDEALNKPFWSLTLNSLEDAYGNNEDDNVNVNEDESVVLLEQCVTDNPQCAEIFMSYGYEFKVTFESSPNLGSIKNVEWKQTIGGSERATKFGEKRRTRSYHLILDSTELANFRQVIEDLDEFSKGFYLKDHEDAYFFARFNGEPEEDPITDNQGLTHIQVNFVEML